MNKIILSLVIVMALFVGVGMVSAAGGFDQYGYNDTARIFNGTGSSWCLAGGYTANCLGIYSPDKLVMKWNAEWIEVILRIGQILHTKLGKIMNGMVRLKEEVAQFGNIK